MTIIATKTSEHDDSIGIMYPVDWPTDDPEAHCTLYYLGKVQDAEFTPEDLLDALDEAQLATPGPTPTAGLEMFGPEKDIPVVRLDSLLLRMQKSALSMSLLKRGIKDASSFPDYQPHVTLQSADTEIPPSITLSAPQVWWATERLTRSK